MQFLNNQHVSADVKHEGNGYTAETYTNILGVVTENLQNEKIVVSADKQIYKLNELYNVQPLGRNLFEEEEDEIKKDLSSYDFDKISKASNSEAVLDAMADNYASSKANSEADKATIKNAYIATAKQQAKDKADQDKELKQYKKENVNESFQLPSLDGVEEVQFVVYSDGEVCSDKTFDINAFSSMTSYVKNEAKKLIDPYADNDNVSFYAVFATEDSDNKFTVQIDTLDDIDDLIDTIAASNAAALKESKFGDDIDQLKNTKQVPFTPEEIEPAEDINKLNDKDLEKQKAFPQSKFKPAKELKEAIAKAYNASMRADDQYSAFVDTLISSRYVIENCPKQNRESFATDIFNQIFG